MAETLVLRQARSKSIWVIVGSIAFVVIGIWMIADPDSSSRRPREWVLFWGWACAAFFSLTVLGGVYGLVKPAEIWLTSEGFQVRARRTHPMIPWGAVERFFITKVHRTKLVSYEFTSAEKLKRQGAASLLPMFGGGPEQLPPHLERAPDDVCDLLESWRQRYAAR